jgi:hypothetical protein
MSGERIDVLAVMDDVEDRLCRLGDSPDDSYITKLREARTAVAELIEAMKLIAATTPVHGMNPKALISAPMSEKVGWNVHFIARAALARVSGGA